MVRTAIFHTKEEIGGAMENRKLGTLKRRKMIDT